MLRRHTRLASALAATSLVAGTAALTGGTATGANAAEGSPLTLWAPAKVVAYSYDGQVYTDLGLRLNAPTEPVEIWSSRASYDEPIVSTWRRPLGGEAYDEVPLPAELAMQDFRGLNDFVDVTITPVNPDKEGADLSLDACLNGNSQRVRPDAPARSPYPWGCPWNPYTLGSVMGIEAGYSSSVTQEWGTELQLRPGRYDVTATITEGYTDFFGIAPADATRSMRMVVQKEEDYYRLPTTDREGTALVPAAQHDAPSDPADLADGPRPDLRSLPAFDIGLNRKGTLLRFGANVWNAGNSPLVVDGFREDDDDHMHAYQYFFDADGEQVDYTSVGEMHWHAENHNHWHFEDFARYRLLNEDQTQAVVSAKQSFCLANTDAIDYTVDGADWHPENTDLSTACGSYNAQSVRQVLSPGSGDTYHQYRYGQAFPVKNVPDGVYWISVEGNPDDGNGRNLVESDYANNDSLRKIKLTTKRGERQVKVFPVGMVDEQMPEFFRAR